MNNINILQNVVIDRAKLADRLKDVKREELKQLLGIKDSQVSNIRRCERSPSADGLLRLILAGVDPNEIAGVKAKKEVA